MIIGKLIGLGDEEQIAECSAWGKGNDESFSGHEARYI